MTEKRFRCLFPVLACTHKAWGPQDFEILNTCHLFFIISHQFLMRGPLCHYCCYFYHSCVCTCVILGTSFLSFIDINWQIILCKFIMYSMMTASLSIVK